MSKILMWVAQEGFRDEELFEPQEAFRARGHIVDVVSHAAGTAVSKAGARLTVGALSCDKVSRYDAFLLVGGPGSMSLAQDARLHHCIVAARDAGLVVGAICFSPNILAAAGVLDGRRASVWNGPGLLEQHGCRWERSDVCTDGDLVTANGPAASVAWAQAVLDLLERRTP